MERRGAFCVLFENADQKAAFSELPEIESG